MTMILLTIGTATLLISSVARLLTDMTQLVSAVKSLRASLCRSKQNAQAPEKSAKGEQIAHRTPAGEIDRTT